MKPSTSRIATTLSCLVATIPVLIIAAGTATAIVDQLYPDVWKASSANDAYVIGVSCGSPCLILILIGLVYAAESSANAFSTRTPYIAIIALHAIWMFKIVPEMLKPYWARSEFYKPAFDQIDRFYIVVVPIIIVLHLIPLYTVFRLPAPGSFNNPKVPTPTN